MNNKGFAITGILYTLFIIFMLTLFSILSGLNTRERLLKKSIESLNYKFSFDYIYYNYDNHRKDAEFDGLYMFYDSDHETYCYSFMRRGTRFIDAVFIDKNVSNNTCIKYNDKYIFDRVYY